MELWDGTSPSRDTGTQRAPDREDWAQLLEEIRNIQSHFNGYDETTLNSYGTLSSVTGLTVEELGNGALHKTVLTLDGVELDTTDGTTPATDGAWGALQLYTFPTGSKQLDSCYFNFDLEADNPGAAGLTATADFDIGVGSTAAAQSTAFSLSGTESDYAEATVALADSASTGDTDTNTTKATHTAEELYLNLRTVDDADHGTAVGLLKVSGTVTILWTMLE